MTRSVFRHLLASLLLGPGCALALEVGEIQVDSALNQLFDAKIPLPTLSLEKLEGVSVKVASPSMFKEFGLDRGSSLDDLVFSIQYDAEGKIYVKVVSVKPIREPSLGLLLEFSWPRGKTFREFTVLLDPVLRLAPQPAGRSKTVLDESGNTETASDQQSPTNDIVINRTIQPPEKWPSSNTQSWAFRPGDTYGPVAPGEGLWGIALKVRPDPGISREQMMQALFQINPEAFRNGGIGNLQVGAFLRIPTLQEIADLTGSEVAKQLAMAKQKTADGAGSDIASAEEAPSSPISTVLIEENANKFAIFSLPSVSSAQPSPFISQPGTVTALRGMTASKMETLDSMKTPSPTLFLEPVSATPLLFLVASEAMASATSQIPPMSIPAQTLFNLQAANTPTPVSAPDLKPMVDQGISPTATVAIAVSTALPDADSAVPSTNQVAEALKPPAQTTPEPVAKVYKGNDQYGPIQPNERLWDIATKVRPDPAVGTDVMVRALFAANPTAFSGKSIDHLKESAILRVPTLQEIVDHTGSSAAKRLLEQQTATAGKAATASPDANTTTPSASNPVATAQAQAVETAKPPVAVEPPVAESPEVAKPPQVAPEAAPEPVAKVYKGNDQYGPIQPNERLWDIAAEVCPDPKIGTDVMVRALFAVNPAAFSGKNIDHLKENAILRVPTLQEIVDHTGSSAAKQLLGQQTATVGKAATASPDANTTTPSTSNPVETSQAVETVETAKPPVAVKPPVAESPEVAKPPQIAPEPVAKVYKGNDQYGPIQPNERLWDIAAEVCPDPKISAEVMVRALFAVNPTAFSGKNIDHLKENAILRIPTLQEIADHTGSSAAKQLLEQQAATGKAATTSPDANTALPSASRPAETAQTVEKEKLPVAKSAEAAKPPQAAPEPAAKVYKGNDQYGPVQPNEWLWYIATKVRPDPVISADIMVRALFAANPTAFSGKDINYLKEGAMLRVPTLQEIADSTGSDVAKQLLEQQAAAGKTATDRAGTAQVAETAKPATTKPVEVTKPPQATPEPVAKVYKGNEQYGPIQSNERLWDIATKVRPDPGISVDLMMRALFAVNPAAFSGKNIDYLKEGATLRVPTLREIADHTGSGVAKQLLEQQAATGKTMPGSSGATQLQSPPPVTAPGVATGSKPELKPAQPPSSVH